MVPPEFVSERVFTGGDQSAFAALSGDSNPIHMDALAARRTQAGSPVVHGVHAVAWALETALDLHGRLPSPLQLTVRFDRFIYTDETVQARIVADGSDGVLIVMTVAGAKVASIRCDQAPSGVGEPHAAAAGAEAVRRTAPRALDLPDLTDAKGQVAIAATEATLSAAYPFLTKEFGVGALGSLLALSTLVGMEAPGLHSIFSKFSVTLVPAPGIGALSYRVRRVQPLLRAVEIEVFGPGLSGAVSCFVRRPPVPQASSASLRDVAPADCSGDRILIVGGSRGLGEITAKLCALGGGDVTITYVVGSADAEAVRADIVANGGRCAVGQLDVTKPVAGQLEQIGPVDGFTHAYYFATTQIFRQKAEALSEKQLSRFLDVHLYGFRAVFEALSDKNPRVRIFYPSSVAVEERPRDAVEYVIAKSAGEILCQALNELSPESTVITERLPRTDTDQTSTVLPVRSAGAADVMPPVIQRMHQASGPTGARR